MNYINYLRHVVYNPEINYRRFDFDCDLAEDSSLMKRTWVAVMPLVSLYRPIGQTISVISGSGRVVVHFVTGVKEGKQRHWAQCGMALGQTGLAVLTVATTVFHFSTGLLITAVVDDLQGMVRIALHIGAGEYSQAGEETLQTLSGACYLGFLLTGALEWMVAFSIVQAVWSAYVARGELVEGKYIEAGLHGTLGCVRLYQMRSYVGKIRERNQLFALYQTLLHRFMKGRQVRALIEHPLQDLQEPLREKRVILRDATGKEYDFGAYVHGFGEALVKGENLTFRQRVVDGKELFEFEFKINHAFRDRLGRVIQEIQGIDPKILRQLLQGSGSHIQGLQVEEQDMGYEKGGLQRVQLSGLGTLCVGMSAHRPNVYDKIVIQMDPGQTIYDLHEMLAFFDLEAAIHASKEEDIARLKLGHLFRTFFPREAYGLERTEEFFALNLDQLREKMIAQVPQMDAVYRAYFDRMIPDEILPGKVRYRINGLGKIAYASGARALTLTLTGVYTDRELFERTASILKMGFLSSEMRHDNGVSAKGIGDDWDTGGADSVYTQLLTAGNCARKDLFEDLVYDSKVRFIISTEALELGTYQYPFDAFGSRMTWMMDYQQRLGILEFIQQEQKWFDDDNEVMCKDRIDPKFFKGIIVPDQKTGEDLLTALRTYQVVESHAKGQETIGGIPVEKFIRIGTRMTKELIT